MTHTAKHTPGPWSVRTADNLTCICTPEGEMQVSLRDTGAGLRPLEVPIQEWLANVHLMAAAPAMYAGGKVLCGLVRDFMNDNRLYDGQVIQAIHNLETALAQAEGK